MIAPTILILSALLSSGATRPVPPPLCLGSQDANHPVIVYLHGIDLKSMSDQEKQQRATLDALGKKLGLRFAAPRSQTDCAKPWTGKLCWPMQTEEEVRKEVSRLLAATAVCGKNTIGWLGFSNGGYFVGKLVQHCIPHPGWAIAIGSAGSWQGGTSASLKTCGSLTLAIGNKDITLKAARDFANYLRSRQGRLDFHEFSGAHEMRSEVLELLLRPRLP